MRTEVLEFLRNLPKSNRDRFNKAFAFLSETKGISFNQRLSYNASGATESNIKKMIYDLKKFHNISDVDVLSKKTKKVPVVSIDGQKLESVTKVGYSIEKTERGTEVNVPWPADKETPETEEKQKKTDLHKEFPFLSDKDCPAELHIVTGLLVASWKRYNALFARLQDVIEEKEEITEAEKLQLTADVNSEFENNARLYLELEHYRDNKEILAAHEALKEHRAKQEVDAMTTEELVKYQKNAAPYLSRANKELSAEATPEDRKELLKERIAEREMRLALVNKKLGMNA